MTAVRHVVEHLKMFVPGGHQPFGAEKVIPWWAPKAAAVPALTVGAGTHGSNSIRVGDLRMHHLAHIKLAGLDRRTPIAKAVERYVSIWDWENEVLRAPHYEKGRLIDLIVNPKKQWPSSSPFRAHIHHVLLSEFALKACLFYQMHCVVLPVSATPSMPIVNNAANNANRKNSGRRSSVSNTSRPSVAAAKGPLAMSNPTVSAPPPSSSPPVSGRPGDVPPPLWAIAKSRSLSDIPTELEGGAASHQHASSQSNSPRTAQSHGYSPSSSGYYQQGDSSASSYGPPGAWAPNSPLVQFRDQAREKFFSKHLQVGEHDAEIIEYLAEVVKEQQTMEMSSGSTLPPVIRLDYSPCKEFKNAFLQK
jgi:hypothetical protein